MGLNYRSVLISYNPYFTHYDSNILLVFENLFSITSSKSIKNLLRMLFRISRAVNCLFSGPLLPNCLFRKLLLPVYFPIPMLSVYLALITVYLEQL